MNDDNLICVLIGIAIGWFGCIWMGRIFDSSFRRFIKDVQESVSKKMTALQPDDSADGDGRNCDEYGCETDR